MSFLNSYISRACENLSCSYKPFHMNAFTLGDGPTSQDESTPIVSPVGDTDEDSRDGKHLSSSLNGGGGRAI